MALSQCWSYGSVHSTSCDRGLGGIRCKSPMSVLVLLRVWILYGRTRKITVALAVAFVLYLCASIALLAYILTAISCKSSRAAKVA